MIDTHSGEGFNLQPQEIDRLEQESGEKNLRGRTAARSRSRSASRRFSTAYRARRVDEVLVSLRDHV
jgi:hypothetical protein